MPKLIMLHGLPGSGKTTQARALVSSSGNLGRINRDDLRAMLFNSVWSGKREQVIVDCEKAIAETLFKHNLSVIVDDTNLTPRHRALWSDFCLRRESPQHFETLDLLCTVSIDECRRRDSLRDSGASVGRAVIDRMALNSDLIDWADRPIILCDIDGTLADGSHREHLVKGEVKNWSEYFAQLYADLPISSTIRAINDLYPTHTICLVSGRPDTYQRETMAWLTQHGVPYHWLFMRAGSDKRLDTDVKAGFLEHMPMGKIEHVYDDRPSVCRMWEAAGLTVTWVRGRDCEEF